MAAMEPLTGGRRWRGEASVSSGAVRPIDKASSFWMGGAGAATGPVTVP